ncbi:MAG: hypothetical protein ACOXZ9_04950 [Bacteroidales bacterium]
MAKFGFLGFILFICSFVLFRPVLILKELNALNLLRSFRVTQKNQKIKADISLLNCVLINPEFVRVISSQARSFPPSLGIYFELHSAEMYAVIFKAKFLAIALPYRDKLFKRKEESVFMLKCLTKSLTYT